MVWTQASNEKQTDLTRAKVQVRFSSDLMLTLIWQITTIDNIKKRKMMFVSAGISLTDSNRTKCNFLPPLLLLLQLCYSSTSNIVFYYPQKKLKRAVFVIAFSSFSCHSEEVNKLSSLLLELSVLYAGFSQKENWLRVQIKICSFFSFFFSILFYVFLIFTSSSITVGEKKVLNNFGLFFFKILNFISFLNCDVKVLLMFWFLKFRLSIH